jgi:putative methanogenesis marker protein 3
MLEVYMIITVNGKAIEADDDAVLGEVIEDQIYHPGSKIAIVRSTELVKKETTDFELATSKGSMILRLNDSSFAHMIEDLIPQIVGLAIRWRTSKLLAIGSFGTDIEVTRGFFKFRRYDCFISLGGFDSSTSYLMIAKVDHQGQYGVDGGVFGRITRGRHLLNELEEGDQILDIKPIVLERKEKDAFVTDDLETKLEAGMSIETHVSVSLSPNSPVSSEHFLVLSRKGHLPITETTSTYNACSKNLDVSLRAEKVAVRDANFVTVRHDGAGEGRVYFYKVRRQLNPSHSLLGEVVKGRELIRLVGAGSDVTITTDPPRMMTIGMTQSQGQAFLEKMGYTQVRTGLEDDGSIIVEQEPELTMNVIEGKAVETFGVPADTINEWEFAEDISPVAVHYIRKITGLDHKPVGTLKVHFTYPGMPLITFEGNQKEGLSLIPEKSFGKVSRKGEIGVTNQSRPQKGLIGMRLDESDEFGPTGEERYGTNIVGSIVSPIERMMKDIKDGDIIYVREVPAEGGEEK